MKLQILYVQDQGKLDTERLVMKAAVDLNVGRCVVVRTKRVDGGKVAGGALLGAYWIPDKEVKAGDFVVLYTKVGAQSEKVSNATTSHFFYWGLSASQWSASVAPVLFELGNWTIGKGDVR